MTSAVVLLLLAAAGGLWASVSAVLLARALERHDVRTPFPFRGIEALTTPAPACRWRSIPPSKDRTRLALPVPPGASARSSVPDDVSDVR